MLLLNGITGFSNVKTISHTIDKDQFKKIWFEIKNILKFKLENLDFNLNGRNFYFAKIKYNNDTIFILINAYYPIIAFASQVNPFNNIYINNIRLSSEFSKFYRVLSVSELESLISTRELKYLNYVELKQLEYFNPNNIGEVIFNYWDWWDVSFYYELWIYKNS